MTATLFAELEEEAVGLVADIDRGSPGREQETRSNARANTVTPGRSSARWWEAPAKQPVSATATSKTHRPMGFGAVRDRSEATHSCRIASSLWSVDRSSADADDLKEIFESDKI